MNKFLIVSFFFLISTATNAQIGLKDELLNIDLEITSDPSKYILARPVEICADMNFNIYVADVIQMKILVFNEEGKYLNSFGNRGRGPGEFLDFTSMYCDDKELIILDNMNRIVTKFSYDGKMISSDLMIEKISWPREFTRINDHFAIMYKQPLSYSLNSNSLNNNLLHIVSSDFKTIKNSLIDYNELNYNSAFVDHRLQLNPGYTSNLVGGNMLFVPGIYYGELFLFSKEGNYDWKLQKTIKNPNIKLQDAFTEYDSGSNPSLPHSTTRFRNTRIKGSVINLTEGVFQVRNRNIVVIYAKLIPEPMPNKYNTLSFHWQLIKEEYDENLLYLGSSIILYQQIKNPMTSMLKWKDSKDRFYFIDMTEKEDLKIKRGFLNFD